MIEDAYGEDGLSVEDQEQLDRIAQRCTRYAFLCLRVARAVHGMPLDKQERIWMRFRFVMAMRR